MTDHNIGTPRPELGEYIFALPVERHMLYFLQTDTEIIIIRILSQHQDVSRHLNWQLSATTLRCVKTDMVTGGYPRSEFT